MGGGDIHTYLHEVSVCSLSSHDPLSLSNTYKNYHIYTVTKRSGVYYIELRWEWQGEKGIGDVLTSHHGVAVP